MMLSIAPARPAGIASRNSYLAILEAAWTAHLAPRTENAPTVISTFAGAGGSSLGYSMAGYRELLAVEWDDNAVETFKLNFPGIPVYHGDIANLSVEQCLEMAGIEPGALDVLDGSPPCQGFSTAGKRVLDDPRNQLFREFVRLLRGLQPRAFVMENVSGMVKGKMKLVFADILRELKASGYRVKAAKLNAMYFNVPQSRERMIFVGVRDDLEREPSFPRAQSRAITLEAALAGVVNSDADLEAADTRRYAVGREWERIQPGGKVRDLRRCLWTRPAPTLTKITGEKITARQPMHPDENRVFTLPESKRIASYPETFAFAGGLVVGKARIGNSVPPLFMRAIAEHVRYTILEADSSGISES